MHECIHIYKTFHLVLYSWAISQIPNYMMRTYTYQA